MHFQKFTTNKARATFLAMKLYGSTQRVLLCICDGMGFSDNEDFNAIKAANTPTLDRLYSQYPFTTIIPGGEAVGLPKGVAGNSEVGHMNLGAGRAVRQDLVRINEAVENNTLKDMDELKKLITHAQNGSKRIHLMCLLSDGGVHAHIEHLKAVLDILKNENVEVFLHAFMDGRDTPKTNGVKYIQEINQQGGFVFASMQGRSIGMDRDRRWEKIELAYKTMTGAGDQTELTPESYIQKEYEREIFDEFITPVLFDTKGAIKSEDAVFFLNFRPDRAKQISLAFCDAKFSHFKNEVRPYFLCMSPYIDEELPQVPILFNREKIKGTLSEYLAKLGHKQLKIAETEKYAHVTYFFNGGEETPFKGEDRILIDSPKEVATYDLKPEMSAPEVLEKLIDKLNDDSYTLYVVNFANPDMVGHTGNFEAAIKAMETIDHCLSELEKTCLKNNIAMLVTADHGNCDQMRYEDGSTQTSHSNSDVPFVLVKEGLDKTEVEKTTHSNYALKDVAPTILHLLGIEKNEYIQGESIYK
ncbi:MAG: phosphoglycerate mutase (2,3-diphosphoglycerate-independent) [Halobacteriovoraceae bacterium]|nr:phosphoglycerate mutase (2,3-diphosphoglycerate-independent) [Halobacteriovoraceae bacterium]|tara:strand:- start:26552 stop:28135 length:1584 start_codon:yes stop_codon:yes gene_type:complete